MIEKYPQPKGIQTPYILLCTAYISILVVSIIISGKYISVLNISISSKIIIYPLIYLIISIIYESYGYNPAKDLIKYGLISSVSISLIIFIAKKIPYHPESPVDQYAFNEVFHQKPLLITTSLLGYFISGKMNISLLSFLKNRLISRIWHRYIIASCLSQSPEIIFTLTSYILIYKYINTSQHNIELNQVGILIASHIFIRIIYSVLCAPLAYIINISIGGTLRSKIKSEAKYDSNTTISSYDIRQKRKSKDHFPLRGDKIYITLLVLFISVLLLTNCITAKYFTIFGISMTTGVITYPFTFLISDIITEVYILSPLSGK